MRTLSAGPQSLPQQLVCLAVGTRLSAHQYLCSQTCRERRWYSTAYHCDVSEYSPVSVIVHKSLGYIHTTRVTWILKLFDIFLNQQTPQGAESIRRGTPVITTH